MKEVISVKLTEARRDGCLIREAAFGGKKVWWRITGPSESLPRKLTRHDMAATGLVFYAMNQRADLYIDGPVSRSLLENLEDFVASWATWCPQFYKRINVIAAEEICDEGPAPPAVGCAVAAFSGGVDSSFTIWRHINHAVGRRSRNVIAGILIQGMDIPLTNETAFTTAMGSASDTLGSIGVPLVALRTNWRSEVCVNWAMEFGTGVSTCLRNWQDMADTGLLGSDFDYLRQILPWGGNPITYHMLSACGFSVVYDGAEFCRTEKVEQILNWPAALENLRVCWEEPITGRNCGVCEKCIRTKLNFMALGAQPSASLSEPPTLTQIFRLRVAGKSEIALLAEIINMARIRGVGGLWVNTLRASLAKNWILLVMKSASLHILTAVYAVRHLVKRLLHSGGLVTGRRGGA